MHEFYTGPSVPLIEIIMPTLRGRKCPISITLGAYGPDGHPEPCFICQDCGQLGPQPGQWNWDIGNGKFCRDCGYTYIRLHEIEW
jgi:hypothetical protein